MSSSGKDFTEVVDLIRKEDPRFERGAYFFIRQALDHTMKGRKVKESEKSEPRNHHVTGQELLEGIREFALEQYGPMSMTLFDHWNVRKCADFGDIVFNLVDYGVLGKTDNDTPEDFENGYDFHEAFSKPFLPKKPWKPANRVFNTDGEDGPGNGRSDSDS